MNYALISCFCGNDCISKISSFGIAKISKVLDTLDADQIWSINNLQKAINITAQNVTIQNTTANQEFWDNFQTCCNLIICCPILDKNNALVLLR